MRKYRGLTLAELLVAIAVLAILASLAAPPLGRLVADQQLSARANSWLNLALYARQEAMRRGKPVQLCQWREDRCVRDDHTAWSVIPVGAVADTPVLRSLPAPAPHIRRQSNRQRYIFRPRGHATNGSFILCDTRGRANARKVIINLAGRPRTQRLPDGGCPL